MSSRGNISGFNALEVENLTYLMPIAHQIVTQLLRLFLFLLICLRVKEGITHRDFKMSNSKFIQWLRFEGLRCKGIRGSGLKIQEHIYVS